MAPATNGRRPPDFNFLLLPRGPFALPFCPNMLGFSLHIYIYIHIYILLSAPSPSSHPGSRATLSVLVPLTRSLSLLVYVDRQLRRFSIGPIADIVRRIMKVRELAENIVIYIKLLI